MRRLSVLAALCGLLAGCSAHEPAPDAKPFAPPPPGKLAIGAAASSTAAFTASTGIHPAILEHYNSMSAPFASGFTGNSEPLIQLQPRNASLTAVTAGRYDDWLRSYAKSVAAYQKPVILGFAPEMNGSWYTWGYTHTTPAAYIAAWRHVVTVFRSAGATNVTWIWTVNVTLGGRRMSSPATWWPGSGWVGMIGIDGYYYGASQDFTTLFQPVLSEVRKLGNQPVLISEVGVAPEAGKAAKIADLFAGASAAKVAGVVYFDLQGNRDWRLDDATALAAFRAAAKEYG